jgi:hypothetical protein
VTVETGPTARLLSSTKTSLVELSAPVRTILLRTTFSPRLIGSARAPFTWATSLRTVAATPIVCALASGAKARPAARAASVARSKARL